MIRGIFCLLFAGAASAATVVTIQPSSTTPNSGDSYLRAAAPTSNFGTSGALVVSGTGAANTNGQFASLLKFDLATAKTAFDAAYGIANWTLDSVQLQLTAATPNNPVFNANAAGLILIEWLADDTWLENGMTWNSLAAVVAAGNESLGSLSYNGANSGHLLAMLSASAGFTHDLTSGSSASFRLAAGEANVSMVVNSRNFGTSGSRPALILSASAVPEPSRLLLIAMGFVSLMRYRRIIRFPEASNRSN